MPLPAVLAVLSGLMSRKGLPHLPEAAWGLAESILLTILGRREHRETSCERSLGGKLCPQSVAGQALELAFVNGSPAAETGARQASG